MTLTRLTRLIVATLFLTTATFGAVTNAHAICDESSSYQQQPGHNHQHPDGNADLDTPMDMSEKDDKLSLADGVLGNVATVCHSGSVGCPGCVTPSDQALHAPTASTLAFRHASESGESADPSSNLRPPKFS
nr:hypothetical protein [uncultured Dongia sp.]